MPLHLSHLSIVPHDVLHNDVFLGRLHLIVNVEAFDRSLGIQKSEF